MPWDIINNLIGYYFIYKIERNLTYNGQSEVSAYLLYQFIISLKVKIILKIINYYSCL